MRKSLAANFEAVNPCSIMLEGFAHGKHKSTEKVRLKILMDDISHNVNVLIVADDLICENLLLGREVLCQQDCRRR